MHRVVNLYFVILLVRVQIFKIRHRIKILVLTFKIRHRIQILRIGVFGIADHQVLTSVSCGRHYKLIRLNLAGGKLP